MEHYNQYIKPVFNDSTPYISEIAFINIATSVLHKTPFYVEFKEGKNDKRGFYQDFNDYLKFLYLCNKKYNKNISDITKNKINTITPCNFYYSYIKIIKDTQNPQLEGQTMILKFGYQINKKINEYFIKNKSQIFNNIFKITVVYSNIYLNFDKCHFLEEKLTLTDNSLDINNEIIFKVFMSKQIERKEKLKKINLL